MKSRHRARETALQILYQFDLIPKDLELQGPELVSKLKQHFDHFKVPEELREFIGEMVAGVLIHKAQLDEIIEKHTSHWRVERMSSVDRSLLRLAVYEMTFMKTAPHPVVINEAIELAKQFGTGETPKFVNGVLDAILSSQK